MNKKNIVIKVLSGIGILTVVATAAIVILCSLAGEDYDDEIYEYNE